MLSHLFKTQLTLISISVNPFALQRATFASSVIAFKEATKNTTKKKAAPKKDVPKKTAKPKKKVPVVKRPATPYSYFVQDYFRENGAELKQLPFAERAKKLSVEWQSLSDTEKDPFVQRGLEDKQRFLSEKDAYEASKGPKRPVNAYLRYFNSIREELKSQNPGYSLPEIGRLGGQRWANLTNDEKEPFVQAFQQEVQQWEKDIAAFKAKN